eukprot:scaffold1023_cov313-Pinguiococcus_pyrenoidosus.AAC.30
MPPDFPSPQSQESQSIARTVYGKDRLLATPHANGQCGTTGLALKDAKIPFEPSLLPGLFRSSNSIRNGRARYFPMGCIADAPAASESTARPMASRWHRRRDSIGAFAAARLQAAPIYGAPKLRACQQQFEAPLFGFPPQIRRSGFLCARATARLAAPRPRVSALSLAWASARVRRSRLLCGAEDACGGAPTPLSSFKRLCRIRFDCAARATSEPRARIEKLP